MSNCLSICLSNFVCLPLSVCLVVCLNLSTSLLTIYPSVYLNICPIVTCTSVRPSVCHSVHVQVCLTVVCLSVSLCLLFCLTVFLLSFVPVPFSACLSPSFVCICRQDLAAQQAKGWATGTAGYACAGLKIKV